MKAHALADRMEVVLKAMKPHIEPKKKSKTEMLRYGFVTAISAIVRSNSTIRLHYWQAYPLDPGKIESANRSIMQARHIIPGAWWKIENVYKMLALRV